MNLFDKLPDNLPEELIETLVASPHVRIERIVSTDHSSPPGFWYDQPEYEWVALVRGFATIEFEDRKQRLFVGDYVLIPPHTKHRIVSTCRFCPTVWLAVFFS